MIKYLMNTFFDFVFKILRIFYKKKSGENIVVICLHKLGDSVFTIEAIKKIRKKYPGQTIKIICLSNTTGIYKKIFNDNLQYYPVLSSDFMLNGRIAKQKLRKLLNSLSPLIIFDLTGAINSASLIFNSTANEIIGINSRLYQKIYDYYSPIRRSPHITYIYIDALKSKFDDIDYNSTDNYQENLNNNGPILIHPFAGWEAKEWELRNYLELAKLLKDNHDVQFIIPPDNYRKINSLKDIKQFTLIETTSTDDLMNVVSGCKLLIGNDSGAVNIANLLGKPVFIIYGPSNPLFHLPLKGLTGHIQKKIQCSPVIEKLCYTDGGRKGCPSFECMKKLTVQEVYNSFYEFYRSNF